MFPGIKQRDGRDHKVSPHWIESFENGSEKKHNHWNESLEIFTIDREAPDAKCKSQQNYSNLFGSIFFHLLSDLLRFVAFPMKLTEKFAPFDIREMECGPGLPTHLNKHQRQSKYSKFERNKILFARAIAQLWFLIVQLDILRSGRKHQNYI